MAMKILSLLFIFWFATPPGRCSANQEKLKWDTSSCKKASKLFNNKNRVVNKLDQVLKSETERKKLLEAQIKAINIYRAELDDSERSVFESMSGLGSLLHEDFKSVIHIKEAVKKRLDAYKSLTIHQEDQYNAISEAEKQLNIANKHNNSRTTSLIGKLLQGVLSDISLQADKLEEKLSDKTFEKTRKNKGASIEAVVRLEDDDAGDDKDDGDNNTGTDAANGDDGDDDDKDGMSILVDSQSNQFVLSKSNDATIPHEDLHFIRDIIWIIVLSFFGAMFCSLVHLPTMFGFVLSGMILGPTGMNIIKSVVQVETLGEFGVFFILFCVGLEFSPDRIKKVWKVSVGGSTLMMILILIFGMFWGACFGILPQQSLFVAACLSLSSTPLVVKFLETKHGDSSKEHTNGNHEYSSSLLGILVMQDVHLGLLVAILPALAGRKGSSPVKPNHGIMHNILHGKDHSNVTGVLDEVVNTSWILFEVALSMISLFLMCMLMAKYLIGPYYRHLQRLGSSELVFLGTISLVFLMLMLTDHLGISMELGCFVAGVVISSHGEQIVKLALHHIEPIRDVFSCLFFASIGLHVFPSFVLNELPITLALTFGVVAIKFFVGVFVLRLFLPQSSNAKYIVASGLAQVSEFSFVLGSRARRFHLISREAYLIILSVTTLSLLFAPLVWRASLRRYGDKRLGKSADRLHKPLKPV
ncbi:transmembrane and coiled-coil domain-containing protein 3 [Nematostella vectensis]|uniref:transmembrane and coiled-coil domain-containing protein 3 n=1 Tax=Nematostella vectensis TaxID=45351 RepID=UPI00138FC650|nr:transmembrane and coiled-coil domain-containing protein 3 [Nematostella vectensis]